jgi:hypothetical protein
VQVPSSEADLARGGVEASSEADLARGGVEALSEADLAEGSPAVPPWRAAGATRFVIVSCVCFRFVG